MSLLCLDRLLFPRSDITLSPLSRQAYKSGLIVLNTTPDLKKMNLRTGPSEPYPISASAPEPAPTSDAPAPAPGPAEKTPEPAPAKEAAAPAAAAPAQAEEAAPLPEIPAHVPYLLVGGGTASFAAFRAIKARDAKAKVSGVMLEWYQF